MPVRPQRRPHHRRQRHHRRGASTNSPPPAHLTLSSYKTSLSTPARHHPRRRHQHRQHQPSSAALSVSIRPIRATTSAKYYLLPPSPPTAATSQWAAELTRSRAMHQGVGSSSGINLASNVTLNTGVGAINTNSYGIQIGANDLIETTSGNITLNAPNNPTEFNFENGSGSLITTNSESDFFDRLGDACYREQLYRHKFAVGIDDLLYRNRVGSVTITLTGTTYPNSTARTNFGFNGAPVISSVDTNVTIIGITTGTTETTGVLNIGSNFSATVSSTGNGNIIIMGQGFGTANNNWGLLLNGASITAHNGSILLEGIGSGSGSDGIEAGSGSVISSTRQVRRRLPSLEPASALATTLICRE